MCRRDPEALSSEVWITKPCGQTSPGPLALPLDWPAKADLGFKQRAELTKSWIKGELTFRVSLLLCMMTQSGHGILDKQVATVSIALFIFPRAGRLSPEAH